MDIQRRQLLKNTGLLLGTLTFGSKLVACGHRPHRVRRKRVRRRLRWARPHVLYVPRHYMSVGTVIMLPDGREGTIQQIHKSSITVIVDGEQSNFEYEIEPEEEIE